MAGKARGSIARRAWRNVRHPVRSQRARTITGLEKRIKTLQEIVDSRNARGEVEGRLVYGSREEEHLSEYALLRLGPLARPPMSPETELRILKRRLAKLEEKPK